MTLEEDTIHPPKGFKAAGIACGLKPNGAKDLALIASDRPASAAGLFTTNQVQAAPVQLNRERLHSGVARAILVNSKNANACTGERGFEDARLSARDVALGLGILEEEVLVSSTGVIGVPLPMDILRPGIRSILPQLQAEGWNDAAEAIMTTDTVPKKAAIRFLLGGSETTVGGMAKGAGMIAPNMATMLAFVCTDADVPSAALSDCLKVAVRRSFNCVTVDGDMSTNDTVLAMANGAAGPKWEESHRKVFQEALSTVCESLARQIARDGEGATKLITVRVSGAQTEESARTVGLSVANSNLVKTAVFGRDPNWGRILCAVGYAGIPIDPGRVSVSMAGIPIYARGVGLSFDHEEAVNALSASEIEIVVDLGLGEAGSALYTCDLTYDYVRINAEYTT